MGEVETAFSTQDDNANGNANMRNVLNCESLCVIIAEPPNGWELKCGDEISTVVHCFKLLSFKIVQFGDEFTVRRFRQF